MRASPLPQARRRSAFRALRRVPLLALLAALGAHAAEFRSVVDNAAVLYDGPSRAATPVFIVSSGYPLEIVTNLGAWLKVRDHTGAFSWVEAKALGTRHMVLVTATSAEARVRPEDSAPVAFVAAQNVALELVELGPPGWLRVRHADGANGYMRASQVWGG